MCDHVRCPPNLERANGLQILQLQIQARRTVHVTKDEGSAKSDWGNIPARLFCLSDRDRHRPMLTRPGLRKRGTSKLRVLVGSRGAFECRRLVATTTLLRHILSDR